MSDQEQVSQLSALFDGELPGDQAQMVIRRALKDPALRATWSRYALIGACVRGEPLSPALPGTDLAARVRARLDAEPDQPAGEAVATAGITGQPTSLWRRGALGGAIAASVALASVLLVRAMAPTVGAPGAAVPQMAQQQPVTVPSVAAPEASSALLAASEPAPRSYTTPVDDSPARRTAPLFNYVAAHNDVAISAVRLAPLSPSISAGFDVTQGAVEMSAAEVGARR